MELVDRDLKRRIQERDDELAKDLSAVDEQWIRWAADQIVGSLARDMEEDGAVRDAVEAALEVRGRAIATQLRGSFDDEMFSRLAAEYAQRHAYERGVLVDISETVRGYVGGSLRRAIESGSDYEQVRFEIAQWFEDLEDWEVYRIAATEVSQASRFANLETTRQYAEDYGIEIEKCIWNAANDACDRCLQREQDSLDNEWTIDEALAMDDVHPQDRCDWIYQVRDAEP